MTIVLFKRLENSSLTNIQVFTLYETVTLPEDYLNDHIQSLKMVIPAQLLNTKLMEVVTDTNDKKTFSFVRSTYRECEQEFVEKTKHKLTNLQSLVACKEIKSEFIFGFGEVDDEVSIYL